MGRVPFGMRRGEQAGARCRRGDSFRMERIPHAPKKNSGRDGVVTSSLSLAAAQGAPAHSFRCSSFSHRKRCTGLRWEPCNFPPRPSLKRPKGAAAPFGNPCSETDGGVFYVGTRDEGLGRGACGHSGRFGLRETRLGVARQISNRHWVFIAFGPCRGGALSQPGFQG